MSFKPTAGAVHGKTMRALNTVMDKVGGDATVALFHSVHQIVMLDHFIDVMPNPAEIMSQFPPQDQWRDTDRKTYEYLMRLAQWRADLDAEVKS